MKRINKLVITPLLFALTSCQGIYFNSFFTGNFSYNGGKMEIKDGLGIYLEQFNMSISSINKDFYEMNEPNNVVKNLSDWNYYYISVSLKFSNSETIYSPSISYYDNDNRRNDSYVFLLNLADPSNASYGLAFSMIPEDDIYYIDLISKSGQTIDVEAWRISIIITEIINKPEAEVSK